MKYIAHSYQKRATQMILDRSHVGLFLDMGLGKTVITLTAVQELIDDFQIFKVLVIAPKRVAEDTWSREHEKWDHLAGLKISKVLGSAKQRQAALKRKADIYVIGRDNVKWLCEELQGEWPFDTVVIDELSSFKNPQAVRFKCLRKVITRSERVIGLTGTPSPNGLMDLWAQIYLLDKGERLGRTLSAYREKYFRPAVKNGYIVYKWAAVPKAQKEIEEKLKDLCISMSADDYLDLPERIDNEIRVTLSQKEMKQYQTMEQEQLLTIEENTVAALNAAAVMNKLLQMANGAVYDEERKVIRIHEKKLEALEEIAETTSSPLLVFYSYKHDLNRIKEYFPEARELKTTEDIKAWNDGKITMLLAHPASIGYGLNLQDGGHVIVWYGMTWSLELYQQANARLHRQGQRQTVIVHHIIADGTADDQVMQALKRKDMGQAALLAALRERKEKKF
jgi:SNF2 family DNA or RNA helicase